MRKKLGKPPVRAGAGALVLAAVTAAGLAAAAPAATAQTAAAAGGHSLSITRQSFGSTTEPYTGKLTPTYRYVLSNGRGVSVDLLSYGAITQAVNVPGKNGKTADVVLGFKTLPDYVANDSPPVTANGGPYFGETVGRYANRIAKGTFKLNGTTYTLPVNNGVNALHGGLNGFGNHVWSQVGGLIRTRNEVGRHPSARQPERRRGRCRGQPRLREGLHRLPGPADR